MDLYVGRKVVCVDDGRLDLEDEIGPTQGEVYTVRHVDGGGECLRLHEICNPRRVYNSECGRYLFCEMRFYAWRFRPLVATNIDVFTKMLTPAPKELQPSE